MKQIAVILLLISGAQAQISAVSCSQSDVTSAIAASSVGGTIIIPSGTCTYTTAVANSPSVNVNKSVTLQGQTTCTGRAATLVCTPSTIILDGTGTADGDDVMDINANNARITGIQFKDNRASVADAKPLIQANAQAWRIDHSQLTSTNAAAATHGIVAQGNGLIDHVDFGPLSVDVFGTCTTATCGGNDGSLSGNYNWAHPLTLGSSNEIYVEDSKFAFTTVADGAYDAYAGGKIVFRFNDISGTNIGSHGLDSGASSQRSILSQEIYNNTFTNNGTHLSTWWNSRGGTHMIFNNVVSAAGGSYDTFLDLRTYRAQQTACSDCAIPICDGTNPIDQNTGGQQGYRCRDQMGAGPETAPLTDWPLVPSGSNPQFSEILAPGYSWANLFKGSAPTVANVSVCAFDNCTEAQTFTMLNNRDFYVEVPSFTGAAGTGSGTLASRPATCTTGAAYWATDQGNWNQSGSGGQGVLSKCTATNTWSVAYTPYTYPHPLSGGSGTVQPPSNLTGVAH